MELDINKLNFDRCEDEPIHIPESIQGYGHLFALDQKNGSIKIISENVQDLITDYDKVLGSNFFNYLEDEADTSFLRETYERARKQETRLPVQLKFKEELIKEGVARDFFAVVYDSDDYFVVELEPAGKFREAYSASQYIKMYAKSVAPKFKTYRDLPSMAQEIVDTIRYITDYERVVLYKFNSDSSGKVIAESKVDDLESYLDLYYPASDIPAQARELYKKNWVRLTPNVNLESSKLIPTVEESDRKPLDLTHSILRSLSPIHRQYVRNQGLKASLSMSLVTHDRLWGIISCHSRVPKYVPQNVRLECENLSQLFSWHLYAKEEELYQKKKEDIDHAINNMLDMTSPEYQILEIFKNNEEEVLKILDTDGFMFYTDEESFSIGTVPEFDAVKEILHKVDAQRKKPFVTDSLPQTLDRDVPLNGLTGILLIPLVENRNYFTAWFRKEHPTTEKWAGAPNEKSAADSKKDRLMPRSSFEVHVKEIRGRSKQWNDNDIEVANRFNKVFMSHALETQHKMRQSIINLKVQDEYKNEFLATLAHELRNPLSPITLAISLLETVEDSNTRENLINTMKKQVGHMTTLIEDLMDVSRITQGKVRLQKEVIKIDEVIKNAVDSCQRLIQEKRHELKIAVPEEPILIDGDITRLSQVFTNILNNSAKYTNPEGHLSIRVEKEGQWVSIRIKDNGLGIPHEKLDTIFMMFTQIDPHSTHTKGGLGIGLTLVQRLVTLHGGKIKARSEGIGKGSEFEVLLPISREKDTALNDTTAASIPGRTRGGKKILVVDDNLDVLSTYDIFLTTEGYEARTASNGRDAIKVFKEFRPDYALLDIGMPDMDGYELCQRLSSTPEAQDKGTVFLSQSGWGNREKVEKALKLGFREHFVKPVNVEKLLDALHKYSHLSTAED